MRIYNNPTCHPDRPHCSHGLCKSCYNKINRKRVSSAGGGRRADCHPERKHLALGLCSPCYCRKRKTEIIGTPASCHPNRSTHGRGLCHVCYSKLPNIKTKSNTRRRALRRSVLLMAYGISESTYNLYLKNQNNLCAICNKSAATKMDHDHKTGHFRGILCNKCNLAIGQARDNIGIIQSCINYLTRYGS